MPRSIVKKIDNTPTEFIPSNHKEYDRNAPKIEDRPMIIVGVKPNRDQKWAVRDFTELKDPTNPDKGVRGTGDALKYYWNNIILEVKNVLLESGPVESVKGADKDALWDTEGMELEIAEAIHYFMGIGDLDETEVKT